MDMAINPNNRKRPDSFLWVPQSVDLHKSTDEILEQLTADISSEQESANIRTLAIQIIETTTIEPGRGHVFLQDVLMEARLHPAEKQRAIDTMKSERDLDKYIVQAYLEDIVTDIYAPTNLNPITYNQSLALPFICKKIPDPFLFRATVHLILTNESFAAQLAQVSQDQ